MGNTTANAALLVHSCDRYQLLYPGFAYFFSRHWDFKVSCAYYLGTEEETVAIEGFTNILSGKGEWTDRLVRLLQEIPERYVLYFQEDMWLDKPVDAAFMNRLVELAQEKSWQQVKLHSSGVYKTNPTGIAVEGLEIARVDNVESGFLMSHQATLWNKDFLLAQLLPGEHPWRNERKGTKRLKKLNPEIYQVDYFAENGAPPININAPDARRSEYQTVSVNAVLNHNSQPFIRELMANPATADYGRKLEHNYTNQITHDGRQKPRKVGIFKRMKNRLQGK